MKFLELTEARKRDPDDEDDYEFIAINLDLVTIIRPVKPGHYFDAQSVITFVNGATVYVTDDQAEIDAECERLFGGAG